MASKHTTTRAHVEQTEQSTTKRTAEAAINTLLGWAFLSLIVAPLGIRYHVGNALNRLPWRTT